MLDQFLPIYWWLGHASRLHPQMTQAEVDACEIPLVAMYLGVRPPGDDDAVTGDFHADAARRNRARIAEAEAAEARDRGPGVAN